MPVPPIDLFAEMAEYLSRFQDVVPYNQVKWFMATQNQEMISYLQDSYGKHKVVAFNGTITTTFDTHPEGQKVSLITWWILGECDEVITTEISSFGTTAAGRTGRHAIVCNQHKFCFRRMSDAPCQDTPFLVDQPLQCLQNLKKLPHQYITSVDASCGYYKWAKIRSDDGQTYWKFD